MPATNSAAHNIATVKAEALIAGGRIHESYSSRVFITEGTRDTYTTTILCVASAGQAGHGRPYAGTCTCKRARAAAHPVSALLCSHVIACIQHIETERLPG